MFVTHSITVDGSTPKHIVSHDTGEADSRIGGMCVRCSKHSFVFGLRLWVMLMFDRIGLGIDRPVLWTRGRGCLELARTISSVEPIRVVGDLVETCVEHRASLLVSRRLPPSADLLASAAPIDFDPDRIEHIVAAVAGGPHSILSAEIAARLSEVIGAPATMVSAYASDEHQGAALATLESLASAVPNLEQRLIEATRMTDMVDQLGPGTLLVLGASGGSWFQRVFFGPGAKLRSEASSGAVVVRSAPRRVFQVMETPIWVGPMLAVDDLLATHEEPVVAVAEDGMLIGIVYREDLTTSTTATVGSVMRVETGIDLMAEIDTLGLSEVAGGAFPVVDDDGRLVGSLRR